MQTQLGADLELSGALVALVGHDLVDGHLVLLDAAGVGVRFGADVTRKGPFSSVQPLVNSQLVAIYKSLAARRAGEAPLVHALVHHQHVLVAHTPGGKTLSANVALVRPLTPMQQHVVPHRLQRREALVANLALKAAVARRVAHHAVRRLEVLAHPLQREEALVAQLALQPVLRRAARRVVAVVRVLVHVEAGRVVVSAAAHFADVRPLAGVQSFVHQQRRWTTVRPAAVRANVQFEVAPLKVLAHAASFQVGLAARTQRAVELAAHAHPQGVASVNVLLEFERRPRHVVALAAVVRGGVRALDVVAALGAAQREAQLAVGARRGSVRDALGVRAQVPPQVGQRVERLEASVARQSVQGLERRRRRVCVVGRLFFDLGVGQHLRLSATHSHARGSVSVFALSLFHTRVGGWASFCYAWVPYSFFFVTLTSATQSIKIRC